MNETSAPITSFPETFPKHRVMVLLVDDQAIVGEAVHRLLSDQPDIDFHYCSQGTEAVQLAAGIKPTVILQDLIMPGIDGLDLVRQFRQTPATNSIPIIVLSTREDAAVKSQAFSLGANDYLVKLPDKAELIARIFYHSRAYLAQIERDEAYRALRKSQRQLTDSNMALTQLSEKLRQNNEALQAAERLARVGNWSWDIAQDHAVWSPMLYELFLWNPDSPAPKFNELRTIFTPESFAAFVVVAEKCGSLGQAYSIDLEGIRTNGDHFFFNAKGQAARDATGTVVSVFGTIHDITEQRKLGEMAQQSAVLEERSRIAGEIHDSLAQSFAAIVLQTEIAEEQLSGTDSAEPRNNIAKARDLARFGLAEARRSALTLRPSHALQRGLIHALKQLAQRTTVPDLLACKMKVTSESRQIEPLIEHELFRIAQEALHNAVRHAKSSEITIELHFQPNDLSLTVTDNGIGLPSEPSADSEGFGLFTMRERAEKAGGTFFVATQPGGGTRVTVTIPLTPYPTHIEK